MSDTGHLSDFVGRHPSYAAGAVLDSLVQTMLFVHRAAPPAV